MATAEGAAEAAGIVGSADRVGAEPPLSTHVRQAAAHQIDLRGAESGVAVGQVAGFGAAAVPLRSASRPRLEVVRRLGSGRRETRPVEEPVEEPEVGEALAESAPEPVEETAEELVADAAEEPVGPEAEAVEAAAEVAEPVEPESEEVAEAADKAVEREPVAPGTEESAEPATEVQEPVEPESTEPAAAADKAVEPEPVAPQTEEPAEPAAEVDEPVDGPVEPAAEAEKPGEPAVEELGGEPVQPASAGVPAPDRAVRIAAAAFVPIALLIKTGLDPRWWANLSLVQGLVLALGIGLAVVGFDWVRRATRPPRALRRRHSELVLQAAEQEAVRIEQARVLLDRLDDPEAAPDAWERFESMTSLSVPRSTRSLIDPQMDPGALVRYLAVRQRVTPAREQGLLIVAAVPYLLCLLPAAAMVLSL